MVNYETLEENIIAWSMARKIIQNSTPTAQFLKAISEFGELADAIGKRDMTKIKDGVGDVLVCLINVCALYDIKMVDCLAHAYGDIKDRRGFMNEDGIFIKEEVK